MKVERFHMENSYEVSNGNGSVKVLLAWLDLRVFYIRISRCEIDDSTPEYLTVNHIPLSPDTLLEVNGVRTGVYSDTISTLLRRDRLDKKTEEATYVSTDIIRVTGSVKFEVFDGDVMLLSGVLGLYNRNGFINDSQRWSMTCKSDVKSGTGTCFLKEKHYMVHESMSPVIEVYVAGSFLDAPIILTNTLQLRSQKKQVTMGGLGSIPEHASTEYEKDVPLPSPTKIPEYPNHKPEDGMYPQMEYMEGEDGELSWFNAGVRVGVGIGLSVSVGLGIGVGLLLRAYQGTATNFRRRRLL